MTHYTGFSDVVKEQTGNFLALHIDTAVEGSTITVELSGSGQEAVKLDSDRVVVIRLAGPDRMFNKFQKIKITASKEGYDTITKTYTLSGLTLINGER